MHWTAGASLPWRRRSPSRRRYSGSSTSAAHTVLALERRPVEGPCSTASGLPSFGHLLADILDDVRECAQRRAVVRDKLTKVGGAHSFKFGISTAHMQKQQNFYNEEDASRRLRVRHDGRFTHKHQVSRRRIFHAGVCVFQHYWGARFHWRDWVNPPPTSVMRRSGDMWLPRASYGAVRFGRTMIVERCGHPSAYPHESPVRGSRSDRRGHIGCP
jgi:hypothetical protein